MIRLYMLLAALAAGAGGLWYVQSLRDALEAERATVAALHREVSLAEIRADQARTAATVARAEADRLRANAAAYDEIREWTLRRDDDAPIPDLLRAVLDRLFGAGPR